MIRQKLEGKRGVFNVRKIPSISFYHWESTCLENIFPDSRREGKTKRAEMKRVIMLGFCLWDCMWRGHIGKNVKCHGTGLPMKDIVCIPRDCRETDSAYGQLPSIIPSKDHTQKLPWVHTNFFPPALEEDSLYNSHIQMKSSCFMMLVKIHCIINRVVTSLTYWLLYFPSLTWLHTTFL